MHTKKIIQTQMLAALEMLKRAIEKCPEMLWLSNEYKNPFWHVAFHTLYYTHLYLQPSEADFNPWEGLRKADAYLDEKRKASDLTPCSKETLLAYTDFCQRQVIQQVEALDLEAGSGFRWLPFSKLELQLYNLRHLQQHTGELCERLGSRGEFEVDWVWRKETAG